jgi:hypothetical protein
MYCTPPRVTNAQAFLRSRAVFLTVLIFEVLGVAAATAKLTGTGSALALLGTIATVEVPLAASA